MHDKENFNPMEQFSLTKYFNLKLFGVDLHFTNSSLIMICTSLFIMLTLFIFLRKPSIIPSKVELFVEYIMNFSKSIAKNAIGEEHYKEHITIITSLFFYIASLNLLGLFMFAPTSHVSITVAIGIICFVYCLVLSLKSRGIKFFGMFVPDSSPLLIAPLIFIIELFSYLSRPISLGIRLAANIIAGHVMILVIANFIDKMGYFGFIPAICVIALTFMEICVCILQAYIFCVLTATYISETYSH